ncbi:MAG: BlaI/MecI/CopY family transcriptional regulator [Vicinamibacterales bacterium]
MARPLSHSLSRRERQIMDVLHRLRRATVAAVREELPSPPSYSAVRALLRILEEKGHVRHLADGPRYLYEPTASREVERRSAVRHLVKTFFDGSTEDAVAALLDSTDQQIAPEQVEALLARIRRAKDEGR